MSPFVIFCTCVSIVLFAILRCVENKTKQRIAREREDLHARVTRVRDCQTMYRWQLLAQISPKPKEKVDWKKEGF